MSKSKIYFCNIDFGHKLTGIERSSFKRAILFDEYLNITPDFITSKFNLNLRKNWLHYKKIGWIPKGSNLINVYEDILGFYEEDKNQSNDFSLSFNDGELKVISDTHERFYKKNSSLNLYIVWRDADKKKLDYINYFFNGKKIRRDKFNDFGQLTVSQYLDEDQKIKSEDLFAFNGKKRITHYYNSDSKMKSIHIFNENGLMIESFNNEHELLEYWLAKKVADNDIYIIDKNRVWSLPLSNIRKENNIKVLSVIHSVHLLAPYEDIYAEGLNYNYSKILKGEHIIDACILLTPQQTSDIEKRFKPKFSLMTIPHANDSKVDKVEYNKRNTKKIITLARLGKEKQLDHMIKAMKIIVGKFPETQLFIYGEGGERKKLEKIINNLELNGNVHLKGYTENISEQLDDSILFLATSKIEGFHMATLESLSHGVPVVSYDFKYGPRALLDSGFNGVIVEKNNINKLADEILYLLSDEEILKKMSNNAYVSIEKYTMCNVAEIWKKELEKL